VLFKQKHDQNISQLIVVGNMITHVLKDDKEDKDDIYGVILDDAPAIIFDY
jgi:hypothetical protein